MPDSVKARHILIPFVGSRAALPETTQTEEQAKKTADSLVTVIKRNKSKFADLAKEFSVDKSNSEKGGSLDMFDYKRMVPEFRDFSFTNKKGTIGVAKTDFGFHIIEIEDQTDYQTVVKLATFGKTIVASEATENTIFQDSEKFALEVSKENKFFDTAEAEVLSKEEEIEMYEQYRSVFAIVKKIDEMIAEIDYLENQPWAKN